MVIEKTAVLGRRAAPSLPGGATAESHTDAQHKIGMRHKTARGALTCTTVGEPSEAIRIDRFPDRPNRRGREDGPKIARESLLFNDKQWPNVFLTHIAGAR